MKFCLIGERLSHSYSAEIHKKCGIDYALCEVPRGGLKEFIARGHDGFNVTIPYKKEIIPYLDGLDESARAIGAVNTAVKRNGGYYGYNTDLAGMRYAFSRKGVSLKGRRIMILGSGGTSDTAKALCDAEGAKTCVKVSRFGEINYENCYNLTDTEIIINATPVGTFPDIAESPLDLSGFGKLRFVFDCVYNPFDTALVMQAKELGINCSDGLPMLVKQAYEAQKIWGIYGGENAEDAIKTLYADKLNVVLTGMPSAGKTSVGKAVAVLLGRRFIDTDAEITAATGRTPAEIIITDGEEFFRDTETEIIKKVSLDKGAVIATGGGAVLREQNVRALKSCGVIFYVKRDLSLLKADGRPLSQGAGAEKLFAERKRFYEGAADFSVDNDGDLKSCAATVARIFGNMKYNPRV